MTRRMPTLSTLLLAGCSLCAVSQASADRFEASLGGGVNYVPMKSMDSLSSAQYYDVFSVQAGIRLPELPLLSGFSTEVGLRWDTGELSGTTFNRISSELDVDALAVDLRLRRTIWGPVSAFGQGGIGWQWSTLRLSDGGSSSSRPLQGKGMALLSSVGGGAEIKLMDTPKFRVGLRVQANYQVATSMSFAATPMSGGEDTLEIATRSSDLGSINTSGLTIRAGLVGSF